MLVVRPRAGQLVGLHKAAFIVWFVSTGIHVLAYLTRLPRLVLGDWRPSLRLPAARLRVGLVATSVVTGAIFAAATLDDADDWITWASHRH
jgi:hypothetical protein